MTATITKTTISQAEPDWVALRQEFPTLENLVYLDISKKAILPRRVEEYMSEWMKDIYENGGNRAYSMESFEETREAVADVFGMPSRNLSLIKNTSEGVNIVAQGFPWREGDNVVISKFEHENNTFPWRHLKKRGVEVRWAAPDVQGRITVDQYRGLVDDRTRIIAAAWVAYGNGYRADIPKIAEFCHNRDIKLVIDGIQAVGVLATPIAELGADVFVTGGHKAQFSLAGAGFMYATDEMIEMLTPPYAAKYSFTSNDRMQALPELAHSGRRFEYGNPNFLGCWIQKRSAEFIAEIGLVNIEARVQFLTTALMEEAKRRQFKIRTSRPWMERAGIVSFDVGGDASTKQAQLRAKNIVVSEKDGHLRSAVHFYNSEDDLTRFLDALETT